MAKLEDFEALLKEVVNGKRLSVSKMDRLTDIAMKNMESDTQLVSILYRNHKSLPANAKISSLYVFDALSRAARNHAQKRQLSVDLYAEKGNCARFLVKVAGVLDGLFRDILATKLPEAKEKTRKILDIWTKSSTFPADVLTGLQGVEKGESEIPLAKEAGQRQTTPTTDPRRQHTPTQTSTPPVPTIAHAHQISTPEAAQAALLALLTSAAGNGSTAPVQIPANTVTHHPSHGTSLAYPAATGSSSFNPNTNGPSSSSERPDVTGSTGPFIRPDYSQNDSQYDQYYRGGGRPHESYGSDIRNDRSFQYDDRRRGGFRGRGESIYRGRGDYRGRGTGRGFSGGNRGGWITQHSDSYSSRKRGSSRSRSPDPQKRFRASQSPQRSVGDRRATLSRDAGIGKDEFGRDIRASSLEREDGDQRFAQGSGRINSPSFGDDIKLPISPPSASARHHSPVQVDAAQSPAHHSATGARKGLEDFDIATFNPTEASSWKALGDAFEVTNGCQPTQEDMMQFIATSMQMAAGMGMGMGMSSDANTGFGTDISPSNAQNAQSYMGPNDWPNLGYTSESQSMSPTDQSMLSPPASTGGSGGQMQRVGDKWVFIRNQGC